MRDVKSGSGLALPSMVPDALQPAVSATAPKFAFSPQL